MACDCPSLLNNSGNDVYGIPVKVGQPLSTLAQRFSTVGSIPFVLNYPGFTVVNCGVVANTRQSNGGIGSMKNFFRYRGPCGNVYNNEQANLAALCCAPAVST